MSDTVALKYFFTFHHYNYGGRTLVVVPSRGIEIPDEYLSLVKSELHHSNNHLIPSNGVIFETLNRLSAGDVVWLKGYLVNVTRPDTPSWRWITTTRDRKDPHNGDIWGNGNIQENMTTCDTMYVTEANILRVPPP